MCQQVLAVSVCAVSGRVPQDMFAAVWSPSCVSCLASDKANHRESVGRKAKGLMGADVRRMIAWLPNCD